TAQHVRLGGARSTQRLEDVLSTGCQRGLYGRYDSGRVDAAVLLGMGTRALPGEAQGPESAQDHAGEPGEAGRILRVQVARVRARRTPLARGHPGDHAVSNTLTSGTDRAKPLGHENPRSPPIRICRSGARHARRGGPRSRAARRPGRSEEYTSEL